MTFNEQSLKELQELNRTMKRIAERLEDPTGSHRKWEVERKIAEMAYEHGKEDGESYGDWVRRTGWNSVGMMRY